MSERSYPIPPTGNVSVIQNANGITRRGIPEGPVSSQSAICMTHAPDDPLFQFLGIGSASGTVWIYQENLSVPKNVETSLFSYTVPAGKNFRLTGYSVWSDTDCEIFLKKDGNKQGGGRTSAARPTFIQKYANDGMELSSASTLSLRVIYFRGGATLPFYAEMQGILEDN